MRARLLTVCLGLAAIAACSEDTRTDEFAALLTMETSWGNHPAYVGWVPVTAGTHRLGCWSIATAQIARFHHLQPHGLVGYVTATYGVAVTNDLDYTYNWTLLVASLSNESPAAVSNEVARYCWAAACIMQKDLGTENYNINSTGRAAEITEHWGAATEEYSPGKGLTRQSMQNVLINEITAGRPVLVYLQGASTSHAFVVDGCRRTATLFEIHANFGWGGVDDGWYDLDQPIVTSLGGTFDDMDFQYVMAIRP